MTCQLQSHVASHCASKCLPWQALWSPSQHAEAQPQDTIKLHQQALHDDVNPAELREVGVLSGGVGGAHL